jgi:hypothetical protein
LGCHAFGFDFKLSFAKPRPAQPMKNYPDMEWNLSQLFSGLAPKLSIPAQVHKPVDGDAVRQQTLPVSQSLGQR